MIKLSVDVKADTWTPLSRRLRAQLRALPLEAYNVFLANTPYRTGNAINRTRLTNRSIIEANYPYAQRLDQGYSRQSPKGMTRPTERFVRAQVKKITGV